MTNHNGKENEKTCHFAAQKKLTTLLINYTSMFLKIKKNDP